MTATGQAVYESSFAVAMADIPRYVAQARQISHDTVIANTGQARKSGVTWTHRPVRKWRQALDELGIPVAADRERTSNDVENLARRFPAGVLVIATVEVDPSVQP